MSNSLLAVQGELKYGFELPQTTTVVEDTTKIDACNKKLIGVEKTALDCQKTSTTQSLSLEVKNGMIRRQQQIIITLTSVMVVFFFLSLFFFIKWMRYTHKKAVPSPFPKTPPNAT